MKRVIVVGGGLVGCALSIFLARRGYKVEIFEKSTDITGRQPGPGRSINLTLCDRGFRTLDRLGISEEIRSLSIPAYGRALHSPQGDVTFQPYGNNGEAIYSIERMDLNHALISCAAQNSNIEFFPNEKCIGLDPSTATVKFENIKSGTVSRRKAEIVFGADGAFSAVRLRMQKSDRFDFSQQYWKQGYKELHVPPSMSLAWTSEKNALHVWPRSRYMLIAFPNRDGSITCSLHLPYGGEPSFESIKTEDDLIGLFEASFPDVLPALPNLAEEYFSRGPNSMVTIRCWPWSIEGRVVLIGDAAHAIYPSYGQGANAGFEDCDVLDECLQQYDEDWPRAIAEYERRRKPNTDAIADLCVEHFVELMDQVGDPTFLRKKEIERRINQLYPTRYMPLYSMITFSCMPYLEALRIDLEQRKIIDRIASIEGIEEKYESPEALSLIDQLPNGYRNS